LDFMIFGALLLLFGHLLNVRKILQPINNDSFPKTYKTY